MNLWLILVPTEKPACIHGKNRFFSTKWHRQWDQKVLQIANGLTILHPSKGYWFNAKGHLFRERMIPVLVNCTKKQIEKIMDLTANYYKQEAVMVIPLPTKAIIKDYK